MDNQRIQQSLALAEHQFRAGDLLNASKILKQIVANAPGSSKANELLAYIYDSQGNYAESFKHLTKACALPGCSAEAFYYLGSAYLEKGDYESAIHNLKKSLGKAGDYFEGLHDLATANAQLGRFELALELYRKCLKFNNNSREVFFNIARIYDELEMHREAIENYDQAIKLSPNYVEAWLNKGVTLKALKKYREAIENYDQAIKLSPNYVEAWLNKGNALSALGQYYEAIANYDQAIKLSPNYVEAWYNKGLALNEAKKFIDAFSVFSRALELNPKHVLALTNQGLSLSFMNKTEEAIAHYDKAIQMDSRCVDAWLNKGVALSRLNRIQEAITHYDKALELEPNYAQAWSNKGIALKVSQRFTEALDHYDKAIKLDPNYAQAWSNKGLALQSLRLFQEAVLHYQRAIHLSPYFAEAWSNLAGAFHELRQYKEALEAYDKALELNANLDYVIGDRLQTQLEICDWSDIDRRISDCILGVKESKMVCQPLPFLGIVDDPELQKKCAQIYVEKKYPEIKSQAGDKQFITASNKIKIAYFSSDFRNHAVCQLIIRALELHDSSQFEVYGFAFGLDVKDDAMRDRASKAFKEFHLVNHLSDLEIADLVRSIGIDIAIDLNGHTQFSRTGIFANRCSPIQVNYLGYPGTMGANYIDYIIADETLIPADSCRHYTEKIIYMPHSYQANDSTKKISDKIFDRKQQGLPENSFVFCCFNACHKILPTTFNSWMRILGKVENSVLWLFESNPLAVKNLGVEAERMGISKERLIFAPKVPLDEHLARHKLADLFLDTLPYNAHTTASDALWSGLPVITCAGSSFASRVAASLLNAVGLSELITQTLHEYETTAIDLAKNPNKLRYYRNKLSENRAKEPLFNTAQFVRDLESNYEKIYHRLRENLPVENLGSLS